MGWEAFTVMERNTCPISTILPLQLLLLLLLLLLLPLHLVIAGVVAFSNGRLMLMAMTANNPVGVWMPLTCNGM